MGRIIIFTGKGGVGKSSLAAAHAAASASEGKKTLLVSTDMAHNLGDLFETEAGRGIRPVMDCLDILELDPDWLMQHEYPDLNGVLAKLIGDKGTSGADSTDRFLMPGFENLFSLLKIRSLYLSGEYDRIIVDCAPTGETLSLLKLPELLTWYMEKFFPVGRFMVRLLSPVSRIKYKVSLPNHKAMDEIEELHARLVHLQELLRDPERSTVRLVCIPEKMVVEETKRNYMYLNLYGYQVDRVFINRILPDATGNEFMDHWKEIQQTYIEEIESVFTSIPVTRIPWFPDEVRGMEAVKKLSEAIGDRSDLFTSPAAVESEIYVPVTDGYKLVISLPREENTPVKVKKYPLDLDITIQNFNRRIPLPNTLKNAKITEIIQEKDKLAIVFQMEEYPEETANKDQEIQIRERMQKRESDAEKRKEKINRFRKATAARGNREHREVMAKKDRDGKNGE